MSHHTREQVKAAFNTAPEILDQLVAAGVPYPRFELFNDASGKLILGDRQDLKPEQIELAARLVMSNREVTCFDCLKCREHTHIVAINFCCGLVTASGTHEG